MFPAWPASTFPSGTSRPIPPATILSIPAYNPQQANSLPPGLAGRRLTSLPTTFLISTEHHLPTKYRSPPFFQNPPITIFPKHLPTASPSSFQTSLRIIPLIFLFPFFHFLYRGQHPPGLHLFVPPISPSNLIQSLSQRPPLLPFCCRFSNQQAKRET